VRFIGTSGWHYKHWRGAFYPEDVRPAAMLDYYVRHFETVELNNTFYRLPTEKAVREWRESTPPGFTFAAKGSRYITHMKKLSDPAPALEKYFSRVDLLGGKLGPVVFQLPPFWECNYERLEQFLAALPGGGRYAFEFRNPTWHNDRVYALLERTGAAWCSWDLAGAQSPVLVTGRFAYVRLHGPGGAYQGSYSDDALAAWARRIDEWTGRGFDSYLYFDNDQAGFAVQDAQRLLRYWR
jgi:uncharacterized protein YecE (DUF72 family)